MLQKRQSPIAGALTLPKGDGNIGSAANDMDVDFTQLLRHVNTPISFLPSRRTSVIPVGSGGTPGKGLWPYSAAGNFAVVSGFSTAPQPLTGRAETHRDIPPGVSRQSHGCGLGLIRYSGRCVIAGQTLSADRQIAGGGLAKSELWGID
jgi:hypothetical protein